MKFKYKIYLTKEINFIFQLKNLVFVAFHRAPNQNCIPSNGPPMLSGGPRYWKNPHLKKLNTRIHLFGGKIFHSCRKCLILFTHLNSSLVGIKILTTHSIKSSIIFNNYFKVFYLGLWKIRNLPYFTFKRDLEIPVIYVTLSNIVRMIYKE